MVLIAKAVMNTNEKLSLMQLSVSKDVRDKETDKNVIGNMFVEVGTLFERNDNSNEFVKNGLKKLRNQINYFDKSHLNKWNQKLLHHYGEAKDPGWFDIVPVNKEIKIVDMLNNSGKYVFFTDWRQR